MKKRVAILFLLLVGVVSLSAAVRQTREEYVEKYKAIAIAHMERYGIPASITMAQGILESDSGNSHLSLSSNNHFGIKCKKSWTGDKVYHDDDAKGECFRAYPSVEASYQDHADFLDQSPRYDSLFAYPSDDYRSWARGLKAAGYATAPDYAERLVKIIESMKLYLLDKENGNKIYSAAKNAVANTEVWWESNIATSDEQINPNAFRVTVNSHKGYGVYRTNHTFYVVAKAHELCKFKALLVSVNRRDILNSHRAKNCYAKKPDRSAPLHRNSGVEAKDIGALCALYGVNKNRRRLDKYSRIEIET